MVIFGGELVNGPEVGRSGRPEVVRKWGVWVNAVALRTRRKFAEGR